jgi:hypothetical protein
VGGVSKLAIRKSWLLQHEHSRRDSGESNDDGSDNNDLLAAEDEELRRRQNLEDNAASFRDEEGEDDPVVENRRRCCCRQKRQDPSSQCSSPKWLPYFMRYCGMFGMSVLNPICCVLAMNYASPSILAPFSGLTLCWVIVASEVVTGEAPSTQQIVACVLIIAGEVIVAVFGDHTNDEGVTVDDVVQSYKEPAFILYFVGLAFWVALLVYWMNFSKSPLLRRFAWGTCGGSMTGCQNFLKDSLTILKDVTQQEQPARLPWFFYLFIVFAAGTAFVGLLFLTVCMKRYDATFSAASFVGSFVVSASIMATAHYNTFQQLKGLVNYILYPLGLAVLMAGVYLLVRESINDENDDDDDYIVTEEEDENQESEVSTKDLGCLTTRICF